MIRYIRDPDIHWDAVRDHIQDALDHSCGEISLQDVYRNLVNDKMGLLVVMDDDQIITSAVIEFIDYPQLRALRVVALGGSRMNDWKEDLDEVLYRWALENGLDRVEIMGREGWVRSLKNLGYKKQYTFLTKEVDHGQERRFTDNQD